MRQILVVDYEYCSGCHTCEIACQQEHGMDPDKYGIKLTQIGPDEIKPRKWQFEFLPIPTDRCDICANRQAKGKLPSCVQHCQAGCLYLRDADDCRSSHWDARLVVSRCNRTGRLDDMRYPTAPCLKWIACCFEMVLSRLFPTYIMRGKARGKQSGENRYSVRISLACVYAQLYRNREELFRFSACSQQSYRWS